LKKEKRDYSSRTVSSNEIIIIKPLIYINKDSRGIKKMKSSDLHRPLPFEIATEKFTSLVRI